VSLKHLSPDDAARYLVEKELDRVKLENDLLKKALQKSMGRKAARRLIWEIRTKKAEDK